jgi:aryl-alcohol dehydrogenase-like predicted oxidoreductase
MRVPAATLGRTGITASRLGLAGAYGIDADATERAFHELGINYFFVTPRMRGVAEGVRRLVRAGHRDELVIASGASIPFGFSVDREFRKSVRALGIEHVDVFHLFWVQAHWYVTGKTWPAIRALKERGLARALAVSCHDRPMARALVDELDLDVLMLRYNAAHRGAESEIFATLPPDRAARPGIVSYTATRWGKLLKPISHGGEKLGPMTAPECYAFALHHPSVDVVLCGARSYTELAESARGAAGGLIDEARYAEVKRFGDAVRSTATGRLGFWRP